MANTLEIGETRLGWLVDGSEDTPDVSCTLHRTADDIQLTIPWSGSGSPYRRWFNSEITSYGDDPSKSKYLYSVPETLWFYDNSGGVTLVGCGERGSSFGMEFGVGRVGVQRVVFGGLNGIDYEQIHGMRSTIPGLSQWLRLRSLSVEHTFGESGLNTLELTLKSPEPIVLHPNFNLLARPNFRYKPSAYGDTSEIVERILIETTIEDIADWQSHERLHRAITLLLGVASWKPFSYNEVRALRRDDPERVLSGDPVGIRWAPAILDGAESYDLPNGSIRFLFSYKDLGPEGVRAWIDLITGKYARGIFPVLDLHLPRQIPIETQVLQCGAGLDTIGYLLDIDSGMSVKQANHRDRNHQSRIERVYRRLSTKMPFEVEDWAPLAAKVYNAGKHANRPEASIEELIEVRRMSVLTFRVWVAEAIGVDRQQLQKAVLTDPAATPTKFGKPAQPS